MNSNINILGFFNPTSHHYVCLNLAILNWWFSVFKLRFIYIHTFCSSQYGYPDPIWLELQFIVFSSCILPHMSNISNDPASLLSKWANPTPAKVFFFSHSTIKIFIITCPAATNVTHREFCIVWNLYNCILLLRKWWSFLRD